MQGLPVRLVLERRNGKLGREEQLLADYAVRNNIKVEELTEKLVARGFVELGPYDLVAGSISFIKHALRRYGKELANVEEPSYPACLTNYYRRKITPGFRLNGAKELLDKGHRFFIKPEAAKRFTGFVADNSYDPRFNGASGQCPVYMSEVVEFVSEWRCYITHNRHTALSFYDGDPKIAPDLGVVSEVVRLSGKHAAPAGYVIDFGVLADGRTAVVEVNDGYAVGAYGDGIEANYWNMISARWQELIGVQW
jgi:hypothetical protein